MKFQKWGKWKFLDTFLHGRAQCIQKFSLAWWYCPRKPCKIHYGIYSIFRVMLSCSSVVHSTFSDPFYIPWCILHSLLHSTFPIVFYIPCHIPWYILHYLFNSTPPAPFYIPGSILYSQPHSQIPCSIQHSQLHSTFPGVFYIPWSILHSLIHSTFPEVYHRGIDS